MKTIIENHIEFYEAEIETHRERGVRAENGQEINHKTRKIAAETVLRWLKIYKQILES